ncbi:hypothetical protein FIU88_12640 [Halomonas sp. THAF12]|nr:hypothetical protein FIU88_12640 [Halomonas sp. THAF12]
MVENNATHGLRCLRSLDVILATRVAAGMPTSHPLDIHPA